jgi:ligand-binding sensor domain-containing protein
MAISNLHHIVPFYCPWYKPIACFFASLCCFVLHGQNNGNPIAPIGSWREHLPYNNTIDVVATNTQIYAATPHALFLVDKQDFEIQRLSKINGLSDIGISKIAYHNQILAIGYANGNIDLYNGSKTYNLPQLKQKNISGDKHVNHIYGHQNTLYISTGIGILAVDLLKYEIKDTYIIGDGGSSIKINAVAADANWLYAATSKGLKKAPINNANLANYANWQLVANFGSQYISHVMANGNSLLVTKNDSIFSLVGNNSTLFYTDALPINAVQLAEQKIVVCHGNSTTSSKVVVLSPTGLIEKTYTNATTIIQPKQAILSSGQLWLADSIKGLTNHNGNTYQNYVPNGPPATTVAALATANNTVWAASGQVTNNWQPTKNRNGLLQLQSDQWKAYNQYNNYTVLDTALDFTAIAINPIDNTPWAGSFGGGLVHITSANQVQIFKQNSSLQSSIGQQNNYLVSGLAFDNDHNLWISNYGATNNLSIRTKTGSFKAIKTPFINAENTIGQLLIDDNNYKWISIPKGGGLLCLNSGANIDNTATYQWKHYKTGTGQGNLPNNEVLSLAKDKQGILWVGTANGIGIIDCGADVFAAKPCDAVLPVVQADQFAGYLFQGEVVQAIAVDAANRKWIGTQKGVWLLSPDGDKTLERFSENNSPLLGNDIRSIAIDGQTGEVFFATNNGICSYRGNATNATNVHNNVLVFPNPVPPNYKGPIAIKGLASNAFVKITELNGRLVYQTRANGGQAIWNGNNLNNEKVSAGVYLALVTDVDTRKQNTVVKIFILK